ncbi:MAPEG family protein [Oceanicoccus sagamiensis]|uniref:Glutathione S-transferase n=1 Tax=Oceanicoccus sagamiensis TaxID=716816 RepID=A0A1X9N7I7_9GAMM|nr:MAPEG family protein [Oceanicoccus sagamiensis]ARN74040.1 glutathione S-transferase [Oceanicoccus sagamiensis]
MSLPSLLSVSPLYVALLGLMFIAFTLRVGFYRVNSKILLGDGDDPEMLRRIRGQGNFIETVPMALFILIVMEVLGASDTWLHSLGATLVIGRLLHYVGLTKLGPEILRAIGMMATVLTIAVGSIWILLDVL